MSTFSERLIKYRTIRGNTKADMARELGIPYTTYQNYENGREPKIETIQLIAKVLEIPTNFLLYDLDHDKNNKHYDDKFYKQELTRRGILNIVNKLRDLGIDYSTDLDKNNDSGIIIISQKNKGDASVSVSDQQLIELETKNNDYFKLQVQDLILKNSNHFLFFSQLQKRNNNI